MGVDEPDPTPTPSPTQTSTPIPNSSPTATPTPTQTATPVPTDLPPAENILPDGSFEDVETTDWEESSSNNYPLIGSFEENDIVAPLSPPNLVWLGGANNETATLSRTVPLTPTRRSEVTYTLEFFYQISSADVCGFDTAVISLNGVSVAEYDLCAENQSADWIKASIPLPSITSESVTLTFEVTTDESSISSFFIDDVSFLAQSPAGDPILNQIYLPFAISPDQ